MKARKWLALLLTLTLLLGVIGIGGITTSANVTEDQLAKLTLYGRTYVKNNTLFLYWTNSGFSFNMNGTGATITVNTSSTTPIYLGYLHVYVDGAFEPTATICIAKNGTYTLAENLPAGNHTIEVRKRNEANYGGSATIGVQSLDIIGGELLADKPAAPTRRIEFVGDSITSGFGNMVSDGSGDYTTATEDGTMTYAVLAAKALGADAQVLSRSGIRFVYSADGLDKVDSWYQHYANTATLPGDNRCTDAWDFDAHPNDVVVINLGTNDNGAKVNGAAISDAEMTKDAVAMLRLVREKNPNALIIWTYGIMGNGRQAALEAAVAQFDDDNAYYLPLGNIKQTTEGMGTHGHPSIQTHINRSADLAAFIAEKKGWDVDYGALLQAQIQFLDAYDDDTALENYTEMSVAAFRRAMSNGRTLASDPSATAEALYEAFVNVKTTYADLTLLTDMSAEYTVLSTCDDDSEWLVSATAAVDTADRKEGTGCFSATASTDGLFFMHLSGYDLTMPEDWQNWFIECWLYVDKPEAIPSGSCLELSQTIDQIEMQWDLTSMDLQSGWNKLQLRISTANINRADDFETLQNVRLFILGGEETLTIKLDDLVLAKGKVAANTDAWSEEIAAAQNALATGEHPAQRVEAAQAALKAAQAAVTQRDMDVTTAALKAAIDALDKPTVLYGDVNADGRVDSSDARVVLQTAVGKLALTEDRTAAADVDGSQTIDSSDARYILQKSVQKLDRFPVEE